MKNLITVELPETSANGDELTTKQILAELHAFLGESFKLEGFLVGNEDLDDEDDSPDILGTPPCYSYNEKLLYTQ